MPEFPLPPLEGAHVLSTSIDEHRVVDCARSPQDQTDGRWGECGPPMEPGHRIARAAVGGQSGDSVGGLRDTVGRVFAVILGRAHRESPRSAAGLPRSPRATYEPAATPPTSEASEQHPPLAKGRFPRPEGVLKENIRGTVEAEDEQHADNLRRERDPFDGSARPQSFRTTSCEGRSARSVEVFVGRHLPKRNPALTGAGDRAAASRSPVVSQSFAFRLLCDNPSEIDWMGRSAAGVVPSPFSGAAPAASQGKSRSGDVMKKDVRPRP